MKKNLLNLGEHSELIFNKLRLLMFWKDFFYRFRIYVRDWEIYLSFLDNLKAAFWIIIINLNSLQRAHDFLSKILLVIPKFFLV